ncbi:hypothetical protein DY000_02015985 [Brassica cretica]|uniref:Uncharacterized protein n=1 Tax=Brassica cretica TaxID=69181 RepID=A0ABQ7DBA4_BRACR|nr:hypothetical protein DY000_02015985 [Brassica cretica]
MSSSFSLVSLNNIHNLCFSTFPFLFLRVHPIGTLSTSIESSPSSEGIMTVSGGFSEGLGLGLSALRRATSIFGIFTRCVIGARRLMGTGGCQSILTSICLVDGGGSTSSDSYVIRVSSIDALEILSMDLDWGPPIDTSAIHRSSSDFLLRNLLLAASLPSPLARNHPQ